MRASIARIKALNPTLNAVVTPMYERALAAAEHVDPGTPFAGVPLLIKDLLAHCAGPRHTNGSRLLAENVADADSELVARLRRAGLVPVGLTSTSELGRARSPREACSGRRATPGHRTLDGRIERRLGGGGCGGDRAAGARQRHGRLAAQPGLVLRRVRAEAQPRPDAQQPARGELLSRLLVEHALTRSVRDSARACSPHRHGSLPGEPYPAPASAAGALSTR